MCVVLLFTLVWDVAYIYSMVVFVRDSKDPLVGIVFGLIFTILTAAWNFVAIRGFIDALKRYKNEK